MTGADAEDRREPSPAQRYAASRRRSSHPATARFAAGFPFELDDFQLRGCRALEDGRGVLVAAPTGAGKTVVGEFAVHLAVESGRKAFYTTPIKALSNQKYADLCRRHGSDQVGLLTGDASINGEAPVVVMTTEVLRNMLYAGSQTLGGLGFVVMDEVHYLADRFRGAVWEEVLIQLPATVQVVSLSATVSNAEEFGAWLETIRGDTEVVVEEHRPVPLWQHMMVGDRLFDLFVDPGDAHRDTRGVRGPVAGTQLPGGAVVNPDLLAAVAGRREDGAGSRRGARYGRREDAGAPRGRRGRPRGGTAASAHVSGPAGKPLTSALTSGPRGKVGRADVVARLDREGLLPAIVFIFSRAGCEDAVAHLVRAGITLISPQEGDRLARDLNQRVTSVAPEELEVLGYWPFLEGLRRGYAAHHAGMLPTFREAVEEFFTAGRIRVVFATETLALGINMPARTVLLEKLVKYNGEAHVEITPAEYTQLTGRAGRRGIDVEGHGVVVWNPRIDPVAVAGLAATRTYPLRSSFRPTYNMAVNLVAQVGFERARAVLETSFAQFQADRSVVGLTSTIRRNDEALAGYAASMTCTAGDFAEYAALREQLTRSEKAASASRRATRAAQIAQSLQVLRVGDVLWLEGRRSGPAVVVATPGPGRGAARMTAVVGLDARLHRIDADDLSRPVVVIDRMALPARFAPGNPASRRDLASSLRIRPSVALDGPPPPPAPDGPPGGPGQRAADDIERLREELRTHPCHRCPDREHHARWAQRWHQLNRETESLRRRVEGRTHSVARTFERICRLLVDQGYLGPADDQDLAVTPSGGLLQRLYLEKDLLAAECLRQGVWRGLDAASLAAVVSCLIHEPRREGIATPRMPNDEVAEAYEQMVGIWSRIEDAETARGLPVTGAPEAGLAWMVHRWARGRRLDDVLWDSDLAAGGFVRRCKQVIDVLDQIADVAATSGTEQGPPGGPALASTAHAAVRAMLRGVVAADRLD
ncbi:MAG: DEAD/DEAH box helicase [Austwickia sp.]|nr:DEAD/DEAH box helicase [Austwickia sp.]